MRTTKEGRKFLVAASLIFIAAVNTGNNLIYLILSLMLSLILISALLLRMNLSGVSIEISRRTAVFAGEQSPVSFIIKNNKRLLPAYSVAAGVENCDPAFFEFVPSGENLFKDHWITFPRRGLYSYGDFIIESSFPFILFSMKKSVTLAGEMLVYPQLRDIHDILPASFACGSSQLFMESSHGDETYSVRDFRQGDDWRRIHWKSSAKASRLLVKEYAADEFRKATIILDNLMPHESENFEKVVSLTGSFSKYFLDEGYLVRVISCRKVIPFGLGEEQLFRILDVLAVIREESLWECPASYVPDGLSVLLLKDHASSLASYASLSDMVIYAAEL